MNNDSVELVQRVLSQPPLSLPGKIICGVDEARSRHHPFELRCFILSPDLVYSPLLSVAMLSALYAMSEAERRRLDDSFKEYYSVGRVPKSAATATMYKAGIPKHAVHEIWSLLNANR